MNASENTRTFHTCGQVHCIAPNIVAEFLSADDTCKDRPGGHTYPHVQFDVILGPNLLNHVQHVLSHFDSTYSMVIATIRNTGNRHISVTNRFDLFYTMLRCQTVKSANNRIEEFDNTLRSEFP